MKITEAYINAAAPNADAVKNGASLFKKGSLANLGASADGTFISGECAGSGKNPYSCSADFADESAPVYRCSCPSRQIPCKHVLGLLFAAANGAKFAEIEVPQDITDKRNKKEQRAAAKSKPKPEVDTNAEPAAPAEKSAAWKRSAVKKIDAQLNGLTECSKILTSIVQTGLGSVDAKSLTAYKQQAKSLDSYFIPAVQDEFYDFLGMFPSARDAQYDYAGQAEKLCRLNTLVERSRTYLTAKRDAPDVLDVESETEELIGYAWKLDELDELGLCERGAELVQLAFHVQRDDDKKRFVDEGFYVSLSSGRILRTRNYRPFKALKHIREEDSVFELLRVPSLAVYPSKSLNPRVRWDAAEFAAITDAERAKIVEHAKPELAPVIRDVKNQLRDLLLAPNPVALVKFARLEAVDGGGFGICDSAGTQLKLAAQPYVQDDFMQLLSHVPAESSSERAMLLLFGNDVVSGTLTAQPLAVVDSAAIVRLAY